MSKHIHTPGPWIAQIREDKHELQVRGPVFEDAPNGCAPIVAFKQHRTGPRKGQEQGWHDFTPQTQADAKLMAAAPDLLAALIVARRFIKVNYIAQYGEETWAGFEQNDDQLQVINKAILTATQP